MAEHTYSKGTHVWFPHKEQGRISAEITSMTEGAGDTFKLAFADECGKKITIGTIVKDIKVRKWDLPPWEVHLSSRRPMISQPSHA